MKEYINQSCGYIWKSNKIKDNYNFYDYESQESLELYVIEGFPESKFKEFINTNIEGISIGYNGAIDIKDVLNLCPNIRTMFLDCDMIINAEFFQYFNNLEYLSFIGNKNEKVNLILPSQLKSFVCIWKSKYQLNLLPDNKLEYLKILIAETDAINTENKVRVKIGDIKRTTYAGKKISRIWLDN